MSGTPPEQLRKRPRWVVIVVATAVISIGIAGVVALTLATSTIFNNNGVSNDVNVSASPELEIAIVSNVVGYPCVSGAAAYAADSAAPIIDGALFNLSVSGFGGDLAKTACVHNNGSTTGQLVIQVSAIVSTEVGGCTPDEVTAGDTTCANGDQGEMDAVSSLRILAEDAGLLNCTVPAPGLENVELNASGVFSVVMEQDFNPGEVCAFNFLVMESTTLPAPPNAAYSIAETDSLSFDIAFVLTDDGTP